MAEKVMDSLVDRFLELESMTEMISASDRRFIAVDDTVHSFKLSRTHPVDKIDRMIKRS